MSLEVFNICTSRFRAHRIVGLHVKLWKSCGGELGLAHGCGLLVVVLKLFQDIGYSHLVISLGSSVEKESVLVPGVLSLDGLTSSRCVHIFRHKTFVIGFIMLRLCDVLGVNLWQSSAILDLLGARDVNLSRSTLAAVVTESFVDVGLSQFRVLTQLPLARCISQSVDKL